MPNIQSAKKRVKVSEKKNLRNRIVKSGVRTSVKKFDAAVEADPQNAQVQLSATVAAIDKAAAQQGIVMPVLLEVNIGGEASKSGVSAEELPKLLEAVGKLEAVRADGLMTIPPPCFDEAEQCRTFTAMQQLYQQMQQIAPLKILSMGMSGDYAAAIRCGATLVRIGSALFGARQYPPQANTLT